MGKYSLNSDKSKKLKPITWELNLNLNLVKIEFDIEGVVNQQYLDLHIDPDDVKEYNIQEATINLWFNGTFKQMAFYGKFEAEQLARVLV